MDGTVLDGVLLDGLFDRLHHAVAGWLVRIGLQGATFQKLAIAVVLILAGYHLTKRLSKIGYRINAPFGMVVEVSVLGAAFTFLAIALPAWMAVQHMPTLASLFSD